MRKIILFAFIVTLLLWGCTSSDGTGNFKLYLTDQPIDNAKEIWVRISEINVQKEDEGFITLWSSGTKEYDLLALQEQEALILDTTLKKGKYTQIRLVVVSGQIVIDGEPPHDMIVSSPEVKIPLVFHIMEDGDIEIVLDFEAEHSIHVVSAGQSEQYILTPIIKVKSIIY